MVQLLCGECIRLQSLRSLSHLRSKHSFDVKIYAGYNFTSLCCKNKTDSKIKEVISMKKTFKKAIVGLITIASLSSLFCINASAANTTVTVSANQTWSYLGNKSRSGDYSYIAMRALAVYPTYGGEDNFRYIQGSANNENGYQICNVLTLDEQSSSASYPSIYEGYLNSNYVNFKFRGNSPNYGATASVVYNPM